LGIKIGFPLPAIIPAEIKGTLIDAAKLLKAYFQQLKNITNMNSKTILC